MIMCFKNSVILHQKYLKNIFMLFLCFKIHLMLSKIINRVKNIYLLKLEIRI